MSKKYKNYHSKYVARLFNRNNLILNLINKHFLMTIKIKNSQNNNNFILIILISTLLNLIKVFLNRNLKI